MNSVSAHLPPTGDLASVNGIEMYYEVHGWDAEKGWPTRARLSELDMDDVYEPMIEGATKTQQR